MIAELPHELLMSLDVLDMLDMLFHFNMRNSEQKTSLGLQAVSRNLYIKGTS